ncbi:MAG: alkene reductase [Bacteroidota bacterium]
MSNSLFEKTTLGNLALSNRIVMAPMTRSRAIGNIPNDLMAEYYGQRAAAGLIITEGTAPSANGLGYARIPGVYTDDQVAGWKKVTTAVHKKGGKIFLQIMHTGRVSHSANMEAGTEIVAPSAIGLANGEMWTDTEGMQAYPTPRSIETSEIPALIQAYVHAAKSAVEAGFDGVEIHAANGYLIEQFINTASNKREDEYGGSVNNRIRFAIEVSKAVAEAIGADKTGIRLSPYGVFNEMAIYPTMDETYLALTKALNDLDLVYIHLVDHSAMGAPTVSQDLVTKIRKTFNNTLILSGGYDGTRGQADLDADKGDLIAFGRPFLANPDLVTRLESGAELNQPNMDTFYTPGAEGYTDYPVLESVG